MDRELARASVARYAAASSSVGRLDLRVLSNSEGVERS